MDKPTLPIELTAPATKATKYDENKPPMALLPPEAMIEVSKVLAFGAEKYGPDNWRKGMRWRRLVGASLRHTFAWLSGKDTDEESGLSHLAHAACCLLFLITYQTGSIGDDDRYVGSK